MNHKLIKKLPFLSFLFFSIILILAAIYFLLPKKPNLPEIFTTDEDNPCVEEGGAAGWSESRGYDLVCCSGLTRIDGRTFLNSDGQCESFAGFDFGLVCTYCGNGICGPGENICNCEADCLGPSVKIKAGLEGLPPDASVKKAAIIRSAGGWSRTSILSAAGEGYLDITGLTDSQNLTIYAHPYLIKTIAGINPADAEEISFSNLITGDLNQDGAINVVDWSWISKNYQAE